LDFTILSANQVYQFYETCQGIMNNRVPSTVLLLWSSICRPVPSTEIWSSCGSDYEGDPSLKCDTTECQYVSMLLNVSMCQPD
jgi:hypothetical protein